VLHLFGVRRSDCFRLSDDVCTGLQLANFCQDVAVDRRSGRCYLPLDEIERFPGATDALLSGRSNPAFRALLRLQAERARAYLASGELLATLVPLRLGFEVRLFAGGGVAILDAIARGGYSTLEDRPRLRRRDFARLGLRAFLRRSFGDGAPAARVS
jgi:phytoene synthase